MLGRSISPLWLRLKGKRQSCPSKGEVAASSWLRSTFSELLEARLSIYVERARLNARMVGAEDMGAADIVESTAVYGGAGYGDANRELFL